MTKKRAKENRLSREAAAVTERDSGLLPAHALALASAPLPLAHFTRAAVTIDEIPFRQVLFGWEAGLRAVATAFAQRGRTLYVLPAPEIFSGEAGRRQIFEITGEQEKGDHPPHHLRFGPPVMARVCKPAENMHVLLDSRLIRPLVAGDHPLGTGDVLPQSMKAVFGFDPPEGTLRRLNGEPLPFHLLESSFMAPDLDAELALAPPRRISFDAGLGSESGLIVQSFGEFDPASWQSEGAFRSLRLSDWRGTIAQERMVREEGRRLGPFILLPWNLSHPASIVPDLLRKFARSASLSAYKCRLLVFPYNETAESGKTLLSLVGEMKNMAADHPGELRHIFMARYRGGAALGLLGTLVDVAWLEAGSPDMAWSARRLATIGIPHITIGTSPTLLADEAALASVMGDERIEITVDDAFGRRLFEAASLSESALFHVLRESLAFKKPPTPLISSSPRSQLPREETWKEAPQSDDTVPENAMTALAEHRERSLAASEAVSKPLP